MASIEQLPTEVCIEIFKFLSYEDQKQCRVVCKLWSQIGTLPEFMRNSKLVVRNNNVEGMKAALKQLKDDDLEDWMYPNVILKTMKCSKELQYVMRRIGKFIRNLKVNEASVYNSLYSHCPNIREVHIIFTTAWSSRLESRMINLKCFTQLEYVDIACAALSQNITLRLLTQLWETEIIKLKGFRIHYIYEHMDLLMDVLKKHAPTLTELCLTFVLPPKLPNTLWQDIFVELKNLRSIKISGNCRLQWLYCIFSSIPKEAPLREIDLYGALETDSFLITIITQKWSPILQHIDLTFCVPVRDSGAIQLLYTRKTLRKLNLSHCRHLSSSALLAGIAANQNPVLRYLELNQVCNIDESTMCLLTERLPNLEVLCLQGLGAAVTNKTVSYIFRNLTRLQTLVLDDCKRINDDGILGVGAEPYSIHRLKGLQKLSLTGCTRITNRSLTEGLISNELRHLELGYSHKITNEGIEQLVFNCPAIEFFGACSCFQLDDDTVLHLALGWPRLRKVNLSNCVKLTKRSLDYFCEHCRYITNVEYYGIDDLEIINVPEYIRTAKSKLNSLQITNSDNKNSETKQDSDSDDNVYENYDDDVMDGYYDSDIGGYHSNRFNTTIGSDVEGDDDSDLDEDDDWEVNENGENQIEANAPIEMEEIDESSNNGNVNIDPDDGNNNEDNNDQHDGYDIDNLEDNDYESSSEHNADIGQGDE